MCTLVSIAMNAEQPTYRLTIEVSMTIAGSKLRLLITGITMSRKSMSSVIVSELSSPMHLIRVGISRTMETACRQFMEPKIKTTWTP